MRCSVSPFRLDLSFFWRLYFQKIIQRDSGLIPWVPARLHLKYTNKHAVDFPMRETALFNQWSAQRSYSTVSSKPRTSDQT